ncbi:MAG: thermonuclease family protein [Candidatus Dadabacteria bacterium]|nr:thermonuclease family protein [Candidatus Dadabacteria bacterium]
MRNSGILKWFIPLLAAAVLAGYGGLPERIADRETGSETFRVVKVIDGDTVRARDGRGRERLIRYEGIDCPEDGGARFPSDPPGRSATLANAGFVKGKKVEVRFGERRFDTYGRLLGFVFADGKNVGLELVRAGLATVFEAEGQDEALMEEMRSARRSAMAARRGIWGGDGNFPPPPQNAGFIIPQNRAADMTGKRVVIRAVITGAERKRKLVVLKTDGGIEIPVFKNALPNFSHFGIVPHKFYKGKTVLVTGRVRMHKGVPGITVWHPMSIFVEG